MLWREGSYFLAIFIHSYSHPTTIFAEKTETKEFSYLVKIQKGMEAWVYNLVSA